MKRAIQFGAGNIGRGFIGAVLSEAGYHVVFADVNMEVIDRINKDGAYTVHIMDVESRDVRISNIRVSIRAAGRSSTRSCAPRSSPRPSGCASCPSSPRPSPKASPRAAPQASGSR
ncbi:MAG: hypothetical protein ACLSHL_13370 [Alistipes communis]